MASRRTIPCILHLKGLLTLCLMTLAETVHFANAISDHHQNHQQQTIHHRNHNHHTHDHDGIHQQQEQSTLSAACIEGSGHGDQTCTLPRTTPMTRIPRGGHSHSHSIPEGLVSTVTPYNIPLTGWKIAFQGLLTGLNILCWLIPLYGVDISPDSLSYMNAFSGGVFLTLALCHLIPEAAHEFVGSSNEILPYVCVLLGYLLIFFVEKIAFAEAHDMLHIEHHPPVTMNGKQQQEKHHSHNHGHSSSESSSSKSSAVILLAALSVHSILEMMALGLARSFTDSAVLTGSIALHQPAESIALLIAFLKTGKSKREILLFLSAFSLMGPIGVTLGILVQEYAPSQLDSIVLAIVAGTFVYVGATEVIPEEFDHARNKYKKFSFLLLGIAAILGITQYTMGMAH